MGGQENAGAMRVLVTGGGGFLGTSICRRLLQTGYEVTAFQRGAAGHLSGAGISVVRGDICDLPALREAAEGCAAIIHTAGKAGLWGRPADYERVNVGGTKAVIQVCQELSIPVLVQTSSPSVVHGGGDIEGGDESMPLETRFLAPYPATKAQAEQMVLKANSARLKTTALRPHLIWGPGDPHILPRLAAKVRHGKLLLPGVNKIIDTVFVENAALAHVKALLELTTEGKCSGKPYFISNDEPLPQGEIIQRLLAAIGIKADIRPVPVSAARFVAAICETTWRLLGIQAEPPATRFAIDQLCTAHWYDIGAAKRDLGYHPELSISEGLIKLQQSVRPV